MINLSSLADGEQLFLRRLSDMHGICSEKNTTKFTPFLNERQQLIAGEFASQNYICNYSMSGGYEKAVRKLCGFFPVYGNPSPEAFPVTGIYIKYRGGAGLTHRDFLGSLMAAGIKRESIGDILPMDEEGKCVIYVLESVSRFILGELKKVGSTGVKCGIHEGEPDVPEQAFENISGTVSSARLDNLIKLATGFSREKSAELIRAGAVQHNYLEQLSISARFEPGDTISIRGFGKMKIDGIGGPTRKGRLPVIISKYK